MTRPAALRIFATSRPSQIGAPVLPMTDHDRTWSHTKVARTGRKEANHVG